MTTLLFLLGFLVLAVAGLGLGLWYMVRSRHSRLAPTPSLQPAPQRSYGPMGRLFDMHDLRFLESQRGCRPGMTARLRRERRKVLSLYLHQVRLDFGRTWAYLRAVAPWSENPEFAPAMVRQLVTFYGMYAALRLHCLLGAFVYVPTDVGSLVGVLQRLQQRTRQTLSRGSTDLHVVSR